MKKINTILIILSMTSLFSCGGSGSAGPASEEVSESTSTVDGEDGKATMFDTDTELSTAVSTLRLKNVVIVDSEDNRIAGNIVPMNKKFSIVYEGVSNYLVKDGKVFPKLGLLVADENGQYIINEEDLFAANMEGYTEEEASVLRATVSVGDPMKPGKYNCTVQIEDKNMPNSFIVSTWSFVVE